MIPLRASTTERVARGFGAGRSPGTCGESGIVIRRTAKRMACRIAGHTLTSPLRSSFRSDMHGPERYAWPPDGLPLHHDVHQEHYEHEEPIGIGLEPCAPGALRGLRA